MVLLPDSGGKVETATYRYVLRGDPTHAKFRGNVRPCLESALRIVAAACMCLAVALLTPAGTAAQQCPAPEPGAPIRFVHAREIAWTNADGNVVRHRTGETRYRDAVLVAVDADTLRARIETAEVALPLSEVRDFRVRCPVGAGRSAFRGLRTGLFVGAGTGLVLGLIAGSAEDSYFGDSPVGVALLGAGALGAAGGLVGALIGASLGQGTAWTRVPLLAPPAPGSSGEWTVGVRVPLGR